MRGEAAVYAAGIPLNLHAKRAPAIDPGARLGESDGDNRLCLLLAVELLAVAPKSRIA
jgi:hypothetical protein